MQQRILALGAAALLVVVAACGDDNKNPASASAPTPSSAVSEAALADGSTLKATAPGQQSPSGDINSLQPTLVATASAGRYASAAFTYRFQVLLGSVVADEGASTTTSYRVSKALEVDTTYSWRARAEYQGAYGPWSAGMSFTTPEFIEGYIRGAEIYDPLTNGKSVGSVIGPVQWIMGVGVKLLTQQSRITYHLPETLEIGEYSLMTTGVAEDNPGDKSKIMAMQEGDGPLTTNDYRYTIEKRGRDYPIPGTIAMRVIDGDSSEEGRIHDTRRVAVGLTDEHWYFWRTEWNHTRAELEITDVTAKRAIYAQSVGLVHVYKPIPHVVHVGAPIARSGWADATVGGMIVKNVWVSARPRPEFPEFGGQ
jgi:hypothetical protein